MSIGKKWSISLQRSSILMFPLLQSAERLRRRGYRVKRYFLHWWQYFALLLTSVTMNRTRAVSVTAGWVVSSPYRLDIRTAYVYRRKCIQWAEFGSQVWMGWGWCTSTPNWKLQALKEVVYLAAIHIWWIPWLEDYPWQLRHWFVHSIPWGRCYPTYDAIPGPEIRSNNGQLQNPSWSGTIQCFWHPLTSILLDYCWF